jgi:hypothetical protein
VHRWAEVAGLSNRSSTGPRVRCLLVAPLVAFVLAPAAGCLAPSKSDASASELVGGTRAVEGQFPSTLYLAFGCTGAKVGPRHILSAAHCVTAQEHGGLLSPALRAGSPIAVSNATVPRAEGTMITVTIAKVWVHPGWVEQSDAVWNPEATAGDVAVIELDAPSEALLARVPEATIDLKPVQPGDLITIGGYGCESFPAESAPTPLKSQKTRVIEGKDTASGARWVGDFFATQSLREPPPPGSVDGGTSSEGLAGLCPGDSGGPVYRDDGSTRLIAGVNSTSADEDWYSRVDLESRFDVGSWLASIRGVRVSGVPSDHYSACTEGLKHVCGAIARAVLASGGEEAFGPARWNPSWVVGPGGRRVWSQRFAKKRISIDAAGTPTIEASADPFCELLGATGAGCGTTLGEADPQALYTCKSGLAERTTCSTICERPAFTGDRVPDRCAADGWVDVCQRASALGGSFFCGSAFGDADPRAVYRCTGEGKGFQKVDCDNCDDGEACATCTAREPTALRCSFPSL